MQEQHKSQTGIKNPWFFVPSLYFAEGVPNSLVVIVSVIMYKTLNISHTQLAFWTSMVSLPWVLKPFWGPHVDTSASKRWWICFTQLSLAGTMFALSLGLLATDFFLLTLCAFALMALLSATHDIAADGFYILGLDSHQQALFVGVRSTFYRVAMIVSQGGLVFAVGYLQTRFPTWQRTHSWALIFAVFGMIYLSISLWHLRFLPYPKADLHFANRPRFSQVFTSFFQQVGGAWILAFLLLYRFGEAQLTKMASIFLLDSVSEGGLGMTTAQVGLIQGVIGALSLLLGGIFGGLCAARYGLKAVFFLMWVALNIPDLFYLYLALVRPESQWVVGVCVCIEQFGYGFGFAGYMLYMIYVASRGIWKTAHYALATGFMALGLMLPGMFSAWIQKDLGYPGFFIWVLSCSLPALLVMQRMPLDPDFARGSV